MLKEEYKLPAGLYKVKTFRTTHPGLSTKKHIYIRRDMIVLGKLKSESNYQDELAFGSLHCIISISSPLNGMAFKRRS